MINLCLHHFAKRKQSAKRAMTMKSLPFTLGIGICRFIVDGFARYKNEHDGQSPAELVLHRTHLYYLIEEMAEAEFRNDNGADAPPRDCRSPSLSLKDLDGVVLVASVQCEVPYFVSVVGARWEL